MIPVSYRKVILRANSRFYTHLLILETTIVNPKCPLCFLINYNLQDVFDEMYNVLNDKFNDKMHI